MNASKILSAVAVALMAVAGAAHAETYEGVHPLTSAANRADVAAEAVVAAHSAKNSGTRPRNCESSRRRNPSSNGPTSRTPPESPSHHRKAAGP